MKIDHVLKKISAFLLLCCSPLLAAEHYLPIEFMNSSGIEDEKIFILIKALDPKTHKDCFIKFNLETGEGKCQLVSKDTSAMDFSYKASDLKNFKIPMVNSGRIYISVGMPMDLQVSEFNHKIIDSDGFKPRDSNYYTLHDKIEFSYNSYGSWINPTAVDFFSLPIRIEQPGAAPHLKAAGVYESFVQVFSMLKNVVNCHDTTDTSIWSKLFIHYKHDNGEETPLRFVAPGKAMTQCLPNTKCFDQKYLNNPQSYGFNYIDQVWEYYKHHTLIIDASELKNHFSLDHYLLTGNVVGNEFIFTSGTQIVEKIKKPSLSIPFFAGAGNEFNHYNNTPKAIIIRQLTSAFEAGLLPAPHGTVIDKNYFKSQKEAGNYYQMNPLLPQSKQGPWYDLYAKALHSIGEDQPIYAFAYDDALGQDGTLHDPNAKNISPVIITLGSLEGVDIPDPLTDSTQYQIEVLIGHHSLVEYQGSALKHGQVLNNVSMPFKVTVNGSEANIYVKNPMVRPYFHGSDGIVINNLGNGRAQIIFPGRKK